jgi:hypothetical protein
MLVHRESGYRLIVEQMGLAGAAKSPAEKAGNSEKKKSTTKFIVGLLKQNSSAFRREHRPEAWTTTNSLALLRQQKCPQSPRSTALAFDRTSRFRPGHPSMKNLTRLNARGLAESIYDFSGHLLPCPFYAHYQLVELLLDCLIVRSLNSKQKEQECQNHT